MDDIYLSQTYGNSTIFVTPLSDKMYRQAGGHGLGGAEGYFICQSSRTHPSAGFEILAKASSFDAAQQIFDALVGSR